MRVHLLLILFFASTILARSARNRRDNNEVRVLHIVINFFKLHELPIIIVVNISNVKRQFMTINRHREKIYKYS